ncbi:MAG TPA: L-seryl-tRNA(Sec) selenium transferase [Thermoguttaceae bacterium]|nr:L-seryl-tRNA(Sec) selenium transferase [Thermoguttaceae bacterium]
MSASKQSLLRKIPAVEVLLGEPPLQQLIETVPRKLVVNAVRAAVEHARDSILHGGSEDVDEEALRRSIVADAMDGVQFASQPQYRKAVNATGVILHTGLGRAVLAQEVVARIATELAGYSLLQIDLETGRRGARTPRIERLLHELTGAEAATVVNNNAAATSIVLNTVARGREVIVSRGQLVEIGGSFRLPEVMEASGAKLVEVGTTNKTHARDYEQAIGENTAALLRVHPSNYKISGFTSEVPLETMVRIARAHDLVMIDDVGAGSLIDVTRFGFESEPTLAESVQMGSDLITCSADKLIGAGQGGIILGRTTLIDAVRRNPLARILRPGKLTLAALETTLALFLDPEEAIRRVPTLRMLARPFDEIAAQAQRIAAVLAQRGVAVQVSVVDGSSQMGSGSLPTQNLPTRLVALSPGTDSAATIARKLRQGKPSVVTRVKTDQVLIDPRTLLDGDEPLLIEAVINVCT